MLVVPDETVIKSIIVDCLSIVTCHENMETTHSHDRADCVFTDSTGQQEARLTELVILAAQAVQMAIFRLWQGTYYIHDYSTSIQLFYVYS